MIVRRLDRKLIEVLFDKPYQAEGRLGGSLVELETEDEEVTLVRRDTEVLGIRCPEKTYLAWLQKMDAPKAMITSVRRALDDSKKAQRERMRGR